MRWSWTQRVSQVHIPLVSLVDIPQIRCGHLAVADLDTVYVPVGMGSGIAGLIGVRDLLGLPSEIVGVVAAAAPAYALSVAAGHVVVVLETAGGVSYRFADGAGLVLVRPSIGAVAEAVFAPVC